MEINSDIFNSELCKLAELIRQTTEENNLTMVLPGLVVAYKKGMEMKKVIVVSPEGVPYDSSERSEYYYEMGRETRKNFDSVLFVFMVGEVWIGTGTAIRPSDDPNRVEAVAITGRTLDGRENTYLYDIKRGFKDKMIFKEREVFLAGSQEGLKAFRLRDFFDGYTSKSKEGGSWKGTLLPMQEV